MITMTDKFVNNKKYDTWPEQTWPKVYQMKHLKKNSNLTAV